MNWGVLPTWDQEKKKRIHTRFLSSASFSSKGLPGLTKSRVIATRSGASSIYTTRDITSDTSSCARAPTGNKPGSFMIIKGNEYAVESNNFDGPLNTRSCKAGRG